MNFSFTNKMVKYEKIEIFNYVDMKLDFTCVDDIVIGVINVMTKTPELTEMAFPTKFITSGTTAPRICSISWKR